nr:disease resistance protein TAO1-like [Ipomoea batatas]
MVPKYLRRRSKEVGECSSANYTLPLFLNNKRIFIIAMVSCSLHPWSLWIGHQNHITRTDYLDGNKELECVVYEQPNEVEEVEVTSIQCQLKYSEHFKTPTLGRFRMSVSKDMVPQDLWSNGAVGCSSANYTSPLFLKKKRIFIVVMISCLFHNWDLFEYTNDGSKRSYKYNRKYNDKGLECRVYDHFTEPNKVEEVEVVIELNPSSVEQGAKENFIIQTCIVHEEEEDDKVCFYPMNPVIKFHQPNRSTLCSWESAVITIKHRSRSPEGSSLKQGHTVMDKDLCIQIKQPSRSVE